MSWVSYNPPTHPFLFVLLFLFLLYSSTHKSFQLRPFIHLQPPPSGSLDSVPITVLTLFFYTHTRFRYHSYLLCPYPTFLVVRMFIQNIQIVDILGLLPTSNFELYSQSVSILKVFLVIYCKERVNVEVYRKETSQD